MDSVVQQCDELLKELVDRLKSPAKMFGSFGSKAPAGDTEKLQACIQNLKPSLHGAIHFRQLMHMLANEPEDPQLKELDTFIGEKPLTAYGVAPYKSLTYNYLLNIKVIITNLSEPEKNIECVSFARIKNLIENTMKGKNIELQTLSQQIATTLQGKPREYGDKAVLTPERAAKDLNIIMMGKLKQATAASSAVNKPLLGSSKRRRTRKTRKTRKVRRL